MFDLLFIALPSNLLLLFISLLQQYFKWITLENQPDLDTTGWLSRLDPGSIWAYQLNTSVLTPTTAVAVWWEEREREHAPWARPQVILDSRPLQQMQHDPTLYNDQGRPSDPCLLIQAASAAALQATDSTGFPLSWKQRFVDVLSRRECFKIYSREESSKIKDRFHVKRFVLVHPNMMCAKTVFVVARYFRTNSAILSKNPAVKMFVV